MPSSFPTLKGIGQAVRDYDVTTLALTSGLFNAMVDEQIDVFNHYASFLRAVT